MKGLVKVASKEAQDLSEDAEGRAESKDAAAKESVSLCVKCGATCLHGLACVGVVAAQAIDRQDRLEDALLSVMGKQKQKCSWPLQKRGLWGPYRANKN